MNSLCKKSVLFLLAVTCFLGSIIAEAAPARRIPNRCLEQASDSEILNELSYRLKSSGSTPDIEKNIQYAFSCNYQNMKAMATDLSTGSTRVSDIDLRTSSICNDIVATLNRKIEQNRPGTIIAAGCNYQILVKVILLNGAFKVETLDLGQSSACDIQAKALNQ